MSFATLPQLAGARVLPNGWTLSCATSNGPVGGPNRTLGNKPSSLGIATFLYAWQKSDDATSRSHPGRINR